jgi:hypothetical protein
MNQKTIIKSENYFFLAHITGPSHVHLKIRISSEEGDKLIIQKLPGIMKCSHGEQDLTEIKRWILDSFEYFNEQYSLKYAPLEAYYFEGDSLRYGFYSSCIKTLFEFLTNMKHYKIISVDDTYDFQYELNNKTDR